MKRPMVIAAAAFLFALVVLNYALSSYALMTGSLLSALAILSLGHKKLRRAVVVPMVLLSATVACFLFYCVDTFDCRHANELVGESLPVEAVMLEALGKSESTKRERYLVETVSVGGIRRKMKLRLSCKKPVNARPYDRLSFTGNVYLLGQDSEDVQRHFKSKRTYLGAYTFSDVTVKPAERRPPYYYILVEKKRSVNILKRLFDEDSAGLLSGLLFGDKSLLSDETYSQIKAAGLAHLLAVSGLHMNCWVYFLFKLLRKRQVKLKVLCVLCFIPIVLLCAFSSFSPSVMRAGIMMGIYFLGLMLERRSDAANSLGTAALCIMLFNPFSVCDVSFLLTVSASLGVILAANCYSKPFERRLESIENDKLRAFLKYAGGSLMITLSAQVATLPVMGAFFGEVQLYSALSNLIISPIVFPTMLLSGAVTLFSGIPFIRYPCVVLLKALTKIIKTVAATVSSLPFSRVHMDTRVFMAWLAAAVLVISIVCVLAKKKTLYVSVITLCCLAALVLSCVTYNTVMGGATRLNVLDVGNGTAVLLRRGNKGCLIGCGGDYYSETSIISALDSSGVKLEMLIIPRNKPTESFSAVGVITESKPQYVLSCDRNFRTFYGAEYSDGYKVDFHGVSIDVTSVGATLRADCTDIYISFLPGEPVSTDASLLIARKALPMGTTLEDFEAVVLTSDMTESLRELHKNKKVFTTATDGEVEIIVTKEKYKVRGCG